MCVIDWWMKPKAMRSEDQRKPKVENRANIVSANVEMDESTTVEKEIELRVSLKVMGPLTKLKYVVQNEISLTLTVLHPIACLGDTKQRQK